MLDGLADNLNDAVAMTVKDTVGQVVREAVEVAVKEVLGNPDLLRAALAQHMPVETPVQQPTQKQQGRSFTEVLKSGWNWLCTKVTQKATQVTSMLVQGLTWCMEKLRKCCPVVGRGYSHLRDGCQSVVKKLGAVGLALWYFRRTYSILLMVGLAGGVIGYFAGPVIGSLLCSLGSMMLTLSAMVLLPLWRFLTGNVRDASNS